MNKINIPFKGMTNVPDDSYSQDGSMSVLLNMRHKGGELVQCQPPATDLTEKKVKQALYHAQSGIWLELSMDGVLQSMNVMSENRLHVENVTSFALIGNMVVVSFADKVEYAIWDRGVYRYLGGLPEAPVLYTKGYSAKSKYFETSSSDLNDNPDSDLYNWKFQKGNVDKTLAYIYQEGGYVDRAWFRIGIRMFDGSYLQIGDILELSAYPNMATKNSYGEVTERIIGAQMLWGSKSAGSYYSEIYYFVPDIYVSNRLGEWKDIIASIDLFSTGSIMSFEVGKLNDDDAGTEVEAGIEIYKTRTAEQLRKAMIEAEFHKIASFDVDGNKLWGIEETSPSMIAVQDVLKGVATHSVVPNNAYTYNSRLHVSDYTEFLFEGYSSPATMKGDLTETEAPWTVYTYINTENGVVIVKKKDKPVYDNSENTYRHLNYFSYPDNRAFKMDVFNGDKMRSVTLSPHPTRNEAYNIEITLVDVVLNAREANEERYYDIPVINDSGWVNAVSEPGERNGMNKSNVLKVSAVDNPFYYPTAQTYKFEGNIVGLASNAEAISTGQFGQYPLFVFTTEGIWAMAVDASGQGAYVSQSPFSREVCSGAVCPVSGGIVFTTQRGVMAISGGQVTELSQPLDGLENLMLQGDLMTAIFGKTGKGLISPVQIREYIQGERGNVKGESGAKLAYNYLHNEVILSNVNYGYSYVYSLTNQEWSIIDRVFDITTNSYPELVVYNNDKQLRYKFEEGNDPVPVVAITRPVKVETLDFKRLRQAALRCTFEGSLNFYVLGSNDGASFVCITGKECPTKSEVDSGITSVSTRRDLITSMSRSKQYKYIAIAVAGNMKGRISLAEMLVEGGFASNQLR